MDFSIENLGKIEYQNGKIFIEQNSRWGSS